MPLKSSIFCCAIRGGETLKRAGHLLGNLAWAWDVRTSLCDNKLGWMAWLGARACLGTCAAPGWLIAATGPITVPRDKEAAPSTCCPNPLFPVETGVVVWALWAAVPTTVKHKAMGVRDWMLGGLPSTWLEKLSMITQSLPHTHSAVVGQQKKQLGLYLVLKIIVRSKMFGKLHSILTVPPWRTTMGLTELQIYSCKMLDKSVKFTLK